MPSNPSDRAFRWLIIITAIFVDLPWNDVAPVPFNEVFVAAGLFVGAQVFAGRARRPALRNAHPRDMIFRERDWPFVTARK